MIRRNPELPDSGKPDTAERELLSLLRGHAKRSSDHWSFKQHTPGKNTTAYFQYPAMMVPQMQGQILAALDHACIGPKRLLDPFVGSGTTLVESMKVGFGFEGHDINPLAVLLCRVKIGPYDASKMADASKRVLARFESDTSDSIEIDYEKRDKWFTAEALVALSRFKRSIRQEPEAAVRRFMWLCMAEAARLASNTRTSTYKLHIRPKDVIDARKSMAVDLINAAVRRNLSLYSANCEGLRKLGCLRGSEYRRKATVHLHDCRLASLPEGVTRTVDFIVTSPPYGDNNTTVTYGQHSFLPLLWIDPEDISENAGADYLASTHEIDRRSLGGSLKEALRRSEALCDRSASFKETFGTLSDDPRKRMAAFYHDLSASFDAFMPRLRAGGFLLWTVGDRHLGGSRIPMSSIVPELLAHHGVRLLDTVGREIPSKRMATKNRDVSTMTSETLLVMRKDRAI